jgi:hypothetical protein
MMRKIFNSKTVVGLFDNDQAVEQAVSRLQKLGFGEEEEDAIQIIDQHRLAQEAPVEVASQEVITQPGKGVTAGGRVAVFDTKASGQGSAAEQEIFEFLTGQGLDEEEARFFSQHMSSGNKLVVVETTKERAGEAGEAMKEASAKVSTD